MKPKTTTHMFLALIAILFVLVGCSPAKASAETITITAADAGKTIELHKGNLLVVTLEGNITTGYNWEMLPQSPALLEQQDLPEVVADSEAIGAGGKISLTFQAAQTGKAVLTLVYHRSWEKDVPPEKTFEVTIVVK